MPIDREAILKQAEKLLRQGKLDGAITEYVRLVHDLADTLDRLGEPARALAVLLELDADAGGYRDVRDRVAQLSRVQAGGRGA